MPPKVTLILTVHNQSPHLRQTYPNYEMILWDNRLIEHTSKVATLRATHHQPARAWLGRDHLC